MLPEDIIATIDLFDAQPVRRCTPLPAGHCNHNYHLHTDSGELLLRIFGTSGVVDHIDRQQEFNYQSRAFRLGLAAEPLLLDPRHRWMLCRFAPGRTPIHDTPLTLEQLAQLGQLLGQLHRCTVPASRASLGERIDGYWQVFVDKHQDGHRQRWQRIRPVIEQLSNELVMDRLCHNDLNPGNLLFDDQQLLLLDWEYADSNDPHFDLASVICEFQLSTAQQQHLLTAYHKTGNVHVDPSRLDRACIGYLTLCWLWHAYHGHLQPSSHHDAAMQQYISQLDQRIVTIP